MKILAWPATDLREFNPYTRLLYERIEKCDVEVSGFSIWGALVHRPDIFHLHWPEYYVAHRNTLKASVGIAGLLVVLVWLRVRATKIVWTIHNLRSHNYRRPRVEKRFWKFLTRRLDGFIALSNSGYEAARQQFPALESLPGFVIPHGHYRDAYPNCVSPSEARRHLGIPETAKVILYFGTIAPYKNVPGLVKVFRELTHPDAVLLVAGACVDASARARLRLEIRKDSRIKAHLKFVARQDVQYFFLASDLVVLPFSEILNSGSAMLALSFDRPILVPEIGALPELQASVGEMWVRTYSGQLSVTLLRDALGWLETRNVGAAAPLSAFDWDCIAARTVNAYHRVLGNISDGVKESGAYAF